MNVTPAEWWCFIGILISAAAQGKGGHLLWEKDTSREERTITRPINYGPGGLNIMAEYRFNIIRSFFPRSFQDKQAEMTGDPWHMVLLMVDGFNSNRHQVVASSAEKVLDECMSAYQPQTTKTGNLPHLSYVLRKPKPLGTEFKVAACPVTGLLISIEI